MKGKTIICWWSGGITSAVACKVALDLFSQNNKCRVIMIDTMNEDKDTYRFKRDCEKWYGLQIESISAIKPKIDYCGNNKPNYTFIDIGIEYGSIKDVWIKHKSLCVATGAICSTEIKRRVREKWQETNHFDHQVFGFEFDKKEFNRSSSMRLNHNYSENVSIWI